MKKTLLLTLILLATLSSFAQGFTNYKAVIADDSGAVLSNQAVSVRFTIFDDDPSSSGVQVFQETHTTTTDANGIIVLNIGESNAMDWFAMDWSVPSHYLQTEYDTGSGFVDMGTQAFRTVPYAQYAFKAQNSIYAEQADEVDFSNITNVPADLSDGDDNTQLTETEVDDFVANNGYLTTEVDGDTTNELQTISKTGNTVTLSDGGGSFTDDNTQLTETEVDDYVANNGYLTTEVDGDTSNELQTISKTGSTVTLSDGGGSFTDDNTQLTETQVDDYVANNGYATGLNGLSDAKTGGYSLFIGSNAGQNDDGTDNYNAGVGYSSLNKNTSGHSNVGMGSFTLSHNETGVMNVAVGSSSLGHNLSGSFNTGIGKSALSHNETGSSNVAVGYFSLLLHESGNGNTAVGNGAGHDNKIGSGNVFLGCQAGYAETGSNKLYIENSTSATPLIGGDFATNEVTINGTLQVTGGTPGAGKVFTSDANGRGSWETPELNDLSDAKVSDNSYFIGEYAGMSDDGTNNGNVGFGKDVLRLNTEGSNNIAIGLSALYSNKANSGSVAIGTSAMMYADNSTTGRETYNTAVGKNALQGSTTASSNTGRYNTSLGAYSLKNNRSGDDNIAIGYNALNSNQTGAQNVAVGNQAGRTNTAGNGNVFLGYRSGYNETGSNKLYIDNSDTATPLIHGDFATDEVTVNANSLTINNVGSGAQLFIKSSGYNRPSTQYFLDDAYKTSTGYSITQDAFFIYHADHNVFIKNGNILPDGHKTRDLGADGTAWDDVYADNFVNQGAAAFTDRSVTNEIIAHPPIAKKDGDFDAKTKDGLYELNPDALPQALRTKNGIKIDEIATYNYKANYEQQVIINEQQNTIEELKKLVDKQQVLLEQLVKEMQTLKQK